MIHFKTISELDQAEGFPPPEHPLFSLNILTNKSHLKKDMEFMCDFYIICFKKVKSGELLYGKTKYDHDKGLMFFTRPRQMLTARGLELEDKGFVHFPLNSCSSDSNLLYKTNKLLGFADE
jgi:AraC family transcriptional regulator, transcriptional activator of pobA